MTPLTRLRSRAIPLVESNVDTDQIIPAQFVNAVGEQALSNAFFAGRRAANPDFVLLKPDMRSRSILLVGNNFGCGSSREAAVWATRAWGIRCLLGLSFHPTFLSNCFQNGLLPITAPAEVHDRLCNQDEEYLIDLPAGVVASGSLSFNIQIDPFSRDLLIRGIDELDYLLERRDKIESYEKNDPKSHDHPG
jgi:3-isopropylmalate/(R)-2-methylmalate dehydratase small subunit